MALNNMYKPRYFIANRTRSKIGIYKNGYLRRFYERRGRRVKRGGLFRHYVLVANNRKWTIARRFIRPIRVRTGYRIKKSSLTSTIHGRPTSHRYSTFLQNAQRLRAFYGICKESTLTSLFTQTRALQGLSSASFFSILESRIDRTLYRRRLFPTVYGCRQYLLHHGVLLNGSLEHSPRKQLRVGDTISIPDFVWRPLFWDLFCRVYYRRWGLFLKTRRFYSRFKKKIRRLRWVSFRGFQSRRRFTQRRLPFFASSYRETRGLPYSSTPVNSKSVYSKRVISTNPSPAVTFKGKPFWRSHSSRFSKDRRFSESIYPKFFQKPQGKFYRIPSLYFFYGPRTYAKEYLRARIQFSTTKLRRAKKGQNGASSFDIKDVWSKWRAKRRVARRRYRDPRTKKWFRVGTPFRSTSFFNIIGQSAIQTGYLNRRRSRIIKAKRSIKFQMNKLKARELAYAEWRKEAQSIEAATSVNIKNSVAFSKIDKKASKYTQPVYRLTAHDRKFVKRASYHHRVVKRILKDFKSVLPPFRKRRSFSSLKQRVFSSQRNLDTGLNAQLLDFLTRRHSFRAAITRRGSLLFSTSGLRKSNKNFFTSNPLSVKKTQTYLQPSSRITSFPSSFVKSRFALDKTAYSTVTNGAILSNHLQQKLVETVSSFSSFTDESNSVNPISFWAKSRNTLREESFNVLSRKRLQLTSLLYAQNLRKSFLPAYRKSTPSFIKVLSSRYAEKKNLRVNTLIKPRSKFSHRFAEKVYKRLNRRVLNLRREAYKASKNHKLREFLERGVVDQSSSSKKTSSTTVSKNKSKFSRRFTRVKRFRYIRRKFARFLRRWRRHLRIRRRHPRIKDVHRYFPAHLQVDLRTLRRVKIATPTLQGIYAGFRLSPAQIASYYSSRGY